MAIFTLNPFVLRQNLMSTLNIAVNLSSYASGLPGSNCSSTNSPSQVNFKWNRNVSGIQSDNILSQSQTIGVSSSVTLFDTGATYAGFSGVISGTSTSVTLTADEAGTVGNGIALVFDGSTVSINAAIAAWNAANSNNLVVLSSGNGSQIPSVAQTVMLSGAVGFVYSFLYLEVDAPVTVLINGTITLYLNPIIIGTNIFSAPFMLNSDIQSVVVTNVSATNPADIFFAAVE